MRGVAALMDGTPLMRTGWSDTDTENQVLDLLCKYFPDWPKPA
ncbi:MAG: hypothetical protein ACRDV2_05820 [Actinomycetes bacterium]